ncbi:hypothetical protein GCM10009716_31860 [Streptomyces sodiiphilus]|uniref:Baseplate assembly protein n=1 Tax=Streptomyces sodiiphilus TaxID=226217 RepID=A0ABN2PG15_9ACTN
MSREPDGLAELLPQWHRMRDAEEGGPLRALLAVIAEQAGLIRGDVEQAYEDWFIETAADWAVPYIGDLVGYRLPPGHESALRAGPDRRPRVFGLLAPRHDVAATVGHRRRKGTFGLLEELSGSVAGWPARAVEFSRLLAHQQPVRLYGAGPGHEGERGAGERRSARGRLADLRDGAALDLAGGPFGTHARSADVRRAGSARRQGGYTPAGLGLFVWRLKPYPVTGAPAYCVDRARNLYTFSILGNDSPLVAGPGPRPETGAALPSPAVAPAPAGGVPAFLRRRQLADRLTDHYGPGKSFTIWRDGRREPVEPADIVVADLTDWTYRPPRGRIAVDPELGRIAFGSRCAPRRGVLVSYHYAFSEDMGAGEYERERDTPPDTRVYRVGPGGPHQRITDAYAHWRSDRDAGRCPGDGVIEITRSGAYQEQLDFELRPGDRLELRAAEGTRPVIRLLDWYSNRPDALTVRAREGARGGRKPPGEKPCAGKPQEPPAPRMVLDGLLITGRGVHVSGPVGALVVRHCTLVPGWSLTPHCAPKAPQEPSLVLERTSACVRIEHSVLGTVVVLGDEVGTDPLPLHIADSVLDATGPDREALTAPDCRHAHAVLHAHRTTVIGEVRTHAVRIAENSIFTGRLHTARRGIGCLRFCYVPPGSRTPPRHRCVPDTADREEAHRIRPVFSSERYGTPAYGRLAPGCPPAVSRGADDHSEMGVFHDLYQPQRDAALRDRLAQYTPAGSDAGIFYVS